MQTGRECTLRAIELKDPDRIPLCLSIESSHKLDVEYRKIISAKFEPDILTTGQYDPDFRPVRSGADEWGCVWSPWDIPWVK